MDTLINRIHRVSHINTHRCPAITFPQIPELAREVGSHDDTAYDAVTSDSADCIADINLVRGGVSEVCLGLDNALLILRATLLLKLDRHGNRTAS